MVPIVGIKSILGPATQTIIKIAFQSRVFSYKKGCGERECANYIKVHAILHDTEVAQVAYAPNVRRLSDLMKFKIPINKKFDLNGDLDDFYFVYSR